MFLVKDTSNQRGCCFGLQLRPKLAGTQPEGGVFGHHSQLSANDSCPLPTMGERHPPTSQSGQERQGSDIQSFPPTAGHAHSGISSNPAGPSVLHPFQVWLDGLNLDPKQHRNRPVTGTAQCPLSLHLWGNRSYLMLESSMPQSGDYRCVWFGVGSCLATQSSQRVERSAAVGTHTCVGAADRTTSPQAFPTMSAG